MTLDRPSAEDVDGTVTTSRRSGGPHLFSAMIWFGTSYGGAVVGYLLVNAIASRLLQDEFGYFVIAVSASMVVGQLGLFGVHRGGLREAARLEDGDTEGLAELRRSVRGASMVTLPVTAAIGAVATWVMFGGDPERWALALAVALLIWFSGQQKLWANYLRGFGHVRLAGMLEGRSGGALVAASQALAIGLVWWLIPGAGLLGALLAMTIGFALPVLWAWLAVWRAWRHARPGRLSVRSLRATVSRYRHFAYIMLLGPVNVHLELWLAGLLLSAADASLFSAANRITALLQIFALTLGVVYSPVVSRLYGRDRETLQRLMRTGATLAVLPTAVLWVPLLAFPGFVLSTIFGGPFEAAAPLLIILTIGSMANVSTGLCQAVLTMTDNEVLVARVQLVALPVRLLLAIVLGTMFDATGLAISAATVTTVSWVVLWYLALRRTGLKTHPTWRPEPRLMLRVRA